MKMPDVPHPDALRARRDQAKILPQLPEAVRRYYERERDRIAAGGFRRYAASPAGQPLQHLDADHAALPNDPSIHRCALAYASDMTISTRAAAHRRSTSTATSWAPAWIMRCGFTALSRRPMLLYSQDSRTPMVPRFGGA